MASTDWREKAPHFEVGGEEGFLKPRGALFREQLSVAGMVRRKNTHSTKTTRMGDPVGSEDGPQWRNVTDLSHTAGSRVYTGEKERPAKPWKSEVDSLLVPWWEIFKESLPRRCLEQCFSTRALQLP